MVNDEASGYLVRVLRTKRRIFKPFRSQIRIVAGAQGVVYFAAVGARWPRSPMPARLA